MTQTHNYRKQKKIPYETRKKLIKFVVDQKMTIIKAHSILGINYSTAKLIIQKYRINGKITKFKKEITSKVERKDSFEYKTLQNEDDIKDISQKLENGLQKNQNKEFNYSSASLVPMIGYSQYWNWIHFQNNWWNFMHQYSNC